MEAHFKSEKKTKKPTGLGHSLVTFLHTYDYNNIITYVI